MNAVGFTAFQKHLVPGNAHHTIAGRVTRRFSQKNEKNHNFSSALTPFISNANLLPLRERESLKMSLIGRMNESYLSSEPRSLTATGAGRVAGGENPPPRNAGAA